MARDRLQFRVLLEEILEPDNTDNLYFQPTKNTAMAYPCIMYRLNNAETEYADNHPYHETTGYQVTVVSSDPDEAIALGREVAKIPMSKFDRFYTADNLNHIVYNVFF